MQRADGSPHYPGFGKDSATFLTTERDILGVGTEAVGTDAAIGAQANPPFPNHSIMHGAGKFGLTQLANVDKLPRDRRGRDGRSAQDRKGIGQPRARHRARAAPLIVASLITAVAPLAPTQSRERSVRRILRLDISPTRP